MKKVYLETFGCQMNVSDSERIATKLIADGYAITDTEESADVVIFNTCSVREKAEHKLLTRIGQISHSENPDQMVGVMGCVAQLEGETLLERKNGVDFVLGTKAVGRVGAAIAKVEQEGSGVYDLGEREENYGWFAEADQRHSPYIGYVPIIEGCNKFCTYCIVPFSRGREKSRPASEIIKDVERLGEEGIKEIHLIGQNVNSYRPRTKAGIEDVKGSTAFSKLLRAVANTGFGRIKFTTSFPRDFHEDIVEAIDEYPNLCNWVHLPVQSGSDSVLRAMRRGHTVENYVKRIEKIKASQRDIAITTDLIIGFPGETVEDFAATLDLVKECRFNGMYMFKYSERPGTPAAKMLDDVSEREKTARFLELKKTQELIQMEINSKLVDRTLSVLAERNSKYSAKHASGHSTCQTVVNFDGRNLSFGEVYTVKIDSFSKHSLSGKVV